MAKTKTILQQLRDFESRNVTFVDPDGSWPIVWERARGIHVWDADGKKYLDLTAAFGVAAAGHANPKVVKAGQAQMARLPHAMGDVHPHALKARARPRVEPNYLRALGTTSEGRVTRIPKIRDSQNSSLRQGHLRQLRFRGGGSRSQNGDARHRQTRNHRLRRRVSRTGLRRAQRHAPRFLSRAVSNATRRVRPFRTISCRRRRKESQTQNRRK